jgi:monoamine oxidase
MQNPDMPTTSTDVVVVGAGMAGVTAARALTGVRARVIVLEAGHRIGGRVHTARDFADDPVELGAEFIHGVKAATWSDARTAGLSFQPVPYVRNSWFSLGGSTRWLPVHLLHPGVWPSLSILLALRRAAAGDVSAAAFIRAQGYRGRALELAQLTLTAHLPGSTDQIGVAGLVADGVLHLERGLNHRVLDGYDQLPRHIADGLDIRFGQRVSAIAWGPDGAEVTLAGGGTVGARAAISSVPHGVLASGALRFDPQLPASKADAIDRIRTGPVAKVLLRFSERFWPSRMAQLVCGAGPVTLYWPTSFGTAGPPVLIGYATGPRGRALSQAGADRAADAVLADLARLFPGSRPHARVTGSRFVDWLTDPNALGGYTYLPPSAVGARAALAAADTGALLWAGSATTWRPVADTVEAAFLSGLRAADQARRILERS